jgi:2-polyprenyl-6-methoxyphenol hydroxylase-like FAD-dependent oxidoreductase
MKPKAPIAGGPLGGLMAAIELYRAGCDVEILEPSPRVPDDRGAGIVMQSETLHISRIAAGLTAAKCQDERRELNAILSRRR